MSNAVPEGFRLLNLPRNPFIEANGPLYGRLEGEQFVMGFLCQAKHCNPMMVCHGGMVATLADMLLLLRTNIQTRLGQFMLTVSPDVDFLAPVKVGDWLEGRAEVLKPSGRPLADFTPGRYFADA